MDFPLLSFEQVLEFRYVRLLPQADCAEYQRSQQDKRGLSRKDEDAS
jgi:hypothetical protein